MNGPAKGATMLNINRQVTRPLRALVPIIKNDLKQGDTEGEAASRPVEERAGAGLVEAALSDDGSGYNKFWDWAEETFDRKRKFLRACMEFAFENNATFPKSGRFETLDDLLRSTNKTRANVTNTGDRLRRETRAATRNVNQREYAQPPAIGRSRSTTERQLRHKLALQLIDIGYKALAVKLHPDKNKGGSAEAMARLNAVRAMLTNAVR